MTNHHATGPRTGEGKARSPQNALKSDHTRTALLRRHSGAALHLVPRSLQPRQGETNSAGQTFWGADQQHTRLRRIVNSTQRNHSLALNHPSLLAKPGSSFRQLPPCLLPSAPGNSGRLDEYHSTLLRPHFADDLRFTTRAEARGGLAPHLRQVGSPLREDGGGRDALEPADHDGAAGGILGKQGVVPRRLHSGG